MINLMTHSSALLLDDHSIFCNFQDHGLFQTELCLIYYPALYFPICFSLCWDSNVGLLQEHIHTPP